MNYDAIDFLMTEDGDIFISNSGDIADTSHDHIASLQQDILYVMKNEEGDWAKYPTIAASLVEFVGEANTRENAKKIEERVKISLINALYIRKEDLEVNVNAAGIHSVFIEVILKAEPTILNSIKSSLVMTIFFDSTDGTLLWAPIQPGGA
jgi:hypothetical protein